MSRLRASLPRLAALAALALASCGEPADRKAAPQVTVEHDAIVFPAGSPQLANILVGTTAPRRETTLRLNGRLVWNEERTARVFTPFSGRVLAIAVRPGERVRAGQLLATIASPELGQAQADARKAEQDHALAAQSLARIEELRGGGVAPAKDLQAAQAEFARTAAEQARTRARLALYGAAGAVDQRLALRSPLAGVVVERNLNPGQELRADAPPEHPLFVVSDPSSLWFLLDVAEADLGAIRPGLEVRLGATALGAGRVAGRVLQIADLVDPQTRTVKVRGAVANPERRLKAEMFVTAEFESPAASGLVVPANAVYLRGERHFAFVQTGNGRFVRRQVTLGPAADGYQTVLSGLSAGDRVVVDGALLLDRILAAGD